MSINSTIAERIDAAAYTGKEAKFLDGVTEREFTPEGIKDYIEANSTLFSTMNGFKAHLQVGDVYSSGTDDVALTPGAYRLVLWKNTVFNEGWTLDPASGALYTQTSGLKLFRGHIFTTGGLTVGGINTIKITKGGTPANTTTQDGTDVDASIHYAAGAGSGIIFGGVANMTAGEFVRVWYLPAGSGGAGSVTMNGHKAHTMFEAIDNSVG